VAYEPEYRKLLQNGDLERRVALAETHMHCCDLCARYCRVDRTMTTEGAVCRTGERAFVHSYGPHHGEEAPLRGWGGSGTIFFSWCNLRCVFCQNWNISHFGTGREATNEELARIMIELQGQGCHNINLVSPSHVVAQILGAIWLAAKEGLRIPIVYNSGGYDSMQALELLEGIVDIYMPDMKFGTDEAAGAYSRTKDYVEVNRAAIREMHRQVGDLEFDERGLAVRGLLVRHLVLPGGLGGTEQVLEFIAREISQATYLNLMAQYRPCYRADECPPLDGPLLLKEYKAARALCDRYGLWRLAEE
jgi:putative pyruvate formate lyase activating enzyme